MIIPKTTPGFLSMYKAHVTCDCGHVETFLTIHPGQSHKCPKCRRALSVEPTESRIYGLVDGKRSTRIQMEYKGR